jgi:uncharacterized protein (TIGR02588 family)
MAQGKRKSHDDTPAIEWMLGIIGALLFLSAVGFLMYEGSRGQDHASAITISVTEVLPVQDAYLVRYAAHNDGTQTLADVQLSARLFDGNSQIESVQGQLDFLPGDSTRAGGFYLRNDPRRYRLEIRAEGYQEP